MQRMARVAIVTDSTADLDPQMAAEAGVTIVPVAIALGVESTHETMPAAVAEGMSLARDASLAPEATMVNAFASTFASLARDHDAVVAVLLSDRLGDAVAAATEARNRIAGRVPVEIVDSRSASLGLGFQALQAAERARQGANAEMIVAELRSSLDRYHVVFSVASVEYLRQSGRIGRSAAIIAEALQLKPLLRIDEGQIVPYERARTLPRAITELAEFVRELPGLVRVAALYTTNRNDAVRLANVIAAETGFPAERITIAPIGPALAAQVGPGALGVAVAESDVR
jgi:DegV family protein with EDD domain